MRSATGSEETPSPALSDTAREKPGEEDDSYRLTCFLTSPCLALSQGLVSQPGISVKAADNKLLIQHDSES